jgi:predicted RNase H-like nuclease
MRFIGVDFGWVSQPSGLAVLDLEGRKLHLRCLDRLSSPAEVLQWMEEWVEKQSAGQPAWIGLDAPVLIPNASSSRPADILAHRLFSRQKAGCYPVNSSLPFAPRVLEFVAALRQRGFATTPPKTFAAPSRQLFEVYPHAASIRLFNLPQILPYKKGPLAQRRQALAEFRSLLATGLAQRTPSFTCKALPEIPQQGRELKAVEDQLDALLCAYAAAHFYYWGHARNNVLGDIHSDAESGFIVFPSF